MNPLTWLLDLIYPPKCVVCHKLLESSRAPVCPHCMDNLPEHDGADPHVRFADRCVATCFYEEPLRASIHRFKFGGCRQYAAVYGKWMAVTIGDKLAGKFDLITWAPVSRKRLKSRGYDQAELLCRALARELGMTPERMLEKHTDNPAQSGMSSAEARRKNARGVYRVTDAERVAGARILLIDDIVTTGATLSECCRVLRAAGAADVVCAALATPGTEERVRPK